MNTKVIFISTFLLLVANFIIAGALELSFDEAYYWAYSENLAWGYFDHPPMVAWFIRLGTSLFGNTEYGVRIIFNIISCSGLLLLNSMLEKKHTFELLLMFLSFPLLGFSGLLALPDGALIFFTTLYFYFLKKYLKKDTIQNTLFLGLTITAMFYSKYHGLLVVLLTVAACPELIKKKSFWSCVAVVIIAYFPHVYWQYTHDFVSLKFHLTGRGEKHFDYKNILNFIGGQIGLLGLLLVPLFFLKISKVKNKSQFSRILYFNSFGFLFFLFLLSFRNQIEANWSGTCGIALILLFASNLGKRSRLLWLCLLPISIGVLARGVALNTEWWAKKLGHMSDSRFHEVSFWHSERIPLIAKTCEKRTIVADSYQIAAKLSFYLNKEIPALHLKSRESQYSLWKYEDKINKKTNICYLTSAPIQKSARIDTGYGKPLFIIPKISLEKIYTLHGK